MTPMPSTLPRRPFSPTDQQVAPLCIGCAPLGNMPEAFAYSVAEEQALATLRAAFSSPINFSDTAPPMEDGVLDRSGIHRVSLRWQRGATETHDPSHPGFLH